MWKVALNKSSSHLEILFKSTCTTCSCDVQLFLYHNKSTEAVNLIENGEIGSWHDAD